MTSPTLRGTIKENLASFPRRAAALPARRGLAAVALCVLDADTDPQLLLIKRVGRGLNPGQWALPGGRVDTDETPTGAALRELDEELGICQDHGAVAGLLDDYVTDSGYSITPVVVLPGGATFPRRNPAEVHSVHRIPVSRLLLDDLPRWRQTRDRGPLLQMPLRRNMVVHAPTGAILWQFREVALLGRPLRVNDLIQPAFTRR